MEDLLIGCMLLFGYMITKGRDSTGFVSAVSAIVGIATIYMVFESKDIDALQKAISIMIAVTVVLRMINDYLEIEE